MTKTSYFNNGEPQIERSDGKLQPIILSDEDKICGAACWDCFWAPCLEVTGMIPLVPGVPEGSKPVSEEEKQEVLARWEGQWDVQPLPPMAVKGPNKSSYKQFTTAHLDEDNFYLSGGTHREEQVSKTSGKVSTGAFTSAQVHAKTKTTVDAVNEAESFKLILLRSPDGRLFVDNIGTFLVSEEPGKLKFQCAAGWPMTLRRAVPPQGAFIQRK